MKQQHRCCLYRIRIKNLELGLRLALAILRIFLVLALISRL
jgi:hypothetical protein